MKSVFTTAFAHNVRFVKMSLLMTVVGGHVSAFFLPHIGELSISVVADWPTIVAKGMASFGREAAIAFVFLSGFFTSHHFRHRETYKECLNKVRHRLTHLYPGYMFALAFTLVVDAAGQRLFHDFYESVQVFRPMLHVDALSVVANCLFLEPTFVDSLGTNGPLWTIGYLVQFYLAYAVCHAVAGSSSLKWAGALMMAVLALIAAADEWATYFLVWLAGTFARGRVPCAMGRRGLAALVGAMLIFIASKFAHLPLASILVALACYLMLLASHTIAVGELVLRWSTLRSLTNAAFSVYLIHMPILYFVAAVVSDQAVLDPPDLILFCVVFLFVTVIAVLVHTIAEPGLRRLGMLLNKPELH